MCKACKESGSTGAVLWEGPSLIDGEPIVVVVTWHSSNRKTGDMAQVWILRRDVKPTDAVKASLDFSICGDCPHRGVLVDGKRKRSCYVNVGQAPQMVWRTYAAGGYPPVDPRLVGEWLAGRGVRLGAYGDPGVAPLWVSAQVSAHAGTVTGYTHQWRWIQAGWERLVMASADSVEDRRAARGRGYRSFYVVPRGSDAPDRAMLCRADADGRSCLDCGACNGTKGRRTVAVDVFIEAHGSGAKYVS